MYSVGIVVLLLILLTGSDGLEGEHVCHHLENKNIEVIITYLKTNEKIVTNWCNDIKKLFRCKKSIVISKVDTKPQIINKKVLVDHCCDGYVRNGSICVPFCKPPCEHGECIGPDLCHCDLGYKGSNCNEQCEPGYWGLNCKEKCDCSYGNDCDFITGGCKTRNQELCGDHGEYDLIKLKCDCYPGWVGTRCENCVKGFWGLDCNTTCDCLSEECDRETGACICKPGYYGPKCSCTDEWCLNEGHCNSTTGNCDCPTEWSGSNCTIPNEIHTELPNITQNTTEINSENKNYEKGRELNNTHYEGKTYESKIKNEIDSNKIYIYSSITAGVVIVLAVGVISFCIYKKYSNRSSRPNDSPHENISLKGFPQVGDEPPYLEPSEMGEPLYEEI